MGVAQVLTDLTNSLLVYCHKVNFSPTSNLLTKNVFSQETFIINGQLKIRKDIRENKWQ